MSEVDSSLLKIIDKSKKDILYYENISVYNTANEEIYTNNDTIKFEKLIPGLQESIDDVRYSGETWFSADEMDVLGIPYTENNHQYVVFAGAIDRHGLESLNYLKNILFTAFFIVLVVVGFSGWFYSGKALQPISMVINEVDKISESNLNKRLEEGNEKDEIARLSFTFNKMLGRLESAFKMQKTFVANASHELRNPLTKITSQLEVSLLKDRSNEEYKILISSVLDDIKNLNEISHRLLQLEKLSNAESNIKFSRVRIDDILWETKSEFLSVNPGCTVHFFVDRLPDDESFLFVKGNTPFLKICFQNLIGNACKFSPDKTVTIKLNSDKNRVSIKFIDNGKGIHEADLPFIFEPFYRSLNTSGTSGYGIGLSLVEKIVRMHQAVIEVNSEINKGSVFTITFTHL